MPNELDLTLTDLEQQDWGPPTFESHLVTECHRLRKKRLRDFTVEDLRIMIGQHISLKYLMPLAIMQLRSQPLAEGDYYAGDLLCNVLRAKGGYWKQNPAHRQEVAEIAGRAIAELQHQEDSGDIRTWIEEALGDFQRNE
jgi:hypothetical protein